MHSLGLFLLLLALFWSIFGVSMWVTTWAMRRSLIHTIERELETVLPRVPAPVATTRGIVTCAGGALYLAQAFASLKALRQTGCTLPVEIYYVGDEEVSKDDRRKFHREFGDSVTFVDATSFNLGVTPRALQGFEIKPYALVLSTFDDILFLDADCAPLKNPEYLFDEPEYLRHGNLFWPDYGINAKLLRPSWITNASQFPKGFETESGQFVVNKTRCLVGIVYAWLLNKHQKFFYRHYYGDKDLFRLGFVMANIPFYQIPYPPGILGSDYWGTGRPLLCTIIQKCPRGKGMLFAHRNMHKRFQKQGITPSWDLYVSNDDEKGTRTTIRWKRPFVGTCLPHKKGQHVPHALTMHCADLATWEASYAD
jgi:alpha 1,2-mannosyltransferase